MAGGLAMIHPLGPKGLAGERGFVPEGGIKSFGPRPAAPGRAEGSSKGPKDSKGSGKGSGKG